MGSQPAQQKTKFLSLRRYFQQVIIGIFVLALMNCIAELPEELPTTLEALIDQLSSRGAINRASAASAIAGMGSKAEPAIPALIKLLEDETPLEWRTVKAPKIGMLGKFSDTSPANEAAGALAAIGSAAIEPLLTAIGSSSVKTRRNACEALAMLLADLLSKTEQESVSVDPRIVDVMRSLLDDGDWHVRMTAADVQEDLRDPRTSDTLLRMATNKKENEYVRSSAIGALVSMEDSRAVDAIIAMLSDPSPSVQLTAAAQTRTCKDPRFVEPLISMLSRPDPSPHRQAIQALVWMRDPRALEPLIKFLERFVVEAQKKGGSQSWMDPLAAMDADQALIEIAGDNFGGPPCEGSEWFHVCYERRAKYWRAWLEAQHIK